MNMGRLFHPTLMITALAGSLLATTAPTHAQFDAQQRQAQCELSAIGSTRARLAIDWIRTACNRLAIDTGALHERNRLFYNCLLNNLSGVQHDAAADRIISACRTAYPP
jgi:hypothetical protein